MSTNGALPSRKWWATQTTAVAALLVAFVNAGEWNKTLTIALIGFLAQAVAGYLIPNSESATGVSSNEPVPSAVR